MQLTPQHLAEIVEAIKKMEQAGGGSDKRRFARLSVVTRVEVLNPVTGRTYTAMTRDLSLEGMGLLQGAPAEKNAVLVVSLPRGRQGTLLAHCKVVHVRELAEGIWGIGTGFVSTTLRNAKDTASAPDKTEAGRIASRMLG